MPKAKAAIDSPKLASFRTTGWRSCHPGEQGVATALGQGRSWEQEKRLFHVSEEAGAETGPGISSGPAGARDVQTEGEQTQSKEEDPMSDCAQAGKLTFKCCCKVPFKNPRQRNGTVPPGQGHLLLSYQCRSSVLVTAHRVTPRPPSMFKSLEDTRGHSNNRSGMRAFFCLCEHFPGRMLSR